VSLLPSDELGVHLQFMTSARLHGCTYGHLDTNIVPQYGLLATLKVTMHCQKCRTPLRLDGSLEDLNPAAYDLLVGTYALLSPCLSHASNSPSTLLTKLQQHIHNSHPASLTRPDHYTYRTYPEDRYWRKFNKMPDHQCSSVIVQRAGAQEDCATDHQCPSYS
jgi:hypothetical protein